MPSWLSRRKVRTCVCAESGSERLQGKACGQVSWPPARPSPCPRPWPPPGLPPARRTGFPSPSTCGGEAEVPSSSGLVFSRLSPEYYEVATAHLCDKEQSCPCLAQEDPQVRWLSAHLPQSLSFPSSLGGSWGEGWSSLMRSGGGSGGWAVSDDAGFVEFMSGQEGYRYLIDCPKRILRGLTLQRAWGCRTQIGRLPWEFLNRRGASAGLGKYWGCGRLFLGCLGASKTSKKAGRVQAASSGLQCIHALGRDHGRSCQSQKHQGPLSWSLSRTPRMSERP